MGSVLGRRASLFLAVALVVLGVAGCGGSSRKSDPAGGAFVAVAQSVRPLPGGVAGSGPVVAVVGDVRIYKSQFDSRLAMEVRGEAEGTQFSPVPPDYTVCVSRLSAVAKPVNGVSPSAEALRARCREDYRVVVRKVMAPLISGQWVLGEAAAEGVAPTEAQVKARFETLHRRQFGTEARFQAYLRSTGENVSDIMFSLEEQMAAQSIFDRVHAPVSSAVSDAMVARYYQEHQSLFELNEKRDLGLIRTLSAAKAAAVKRELESGVSFAAVARKYAKEQPVYTFGRGLIFALKPHVFGEPALNDAIFTARQGVVGGPVHLHITRGLNSPEPNVVRKVQRVNGYYVFRVNKITLASHKTLAQAKATIARQLPTILSKQAVAAFVRGWRERWIAKTTCQGEYVVRGCREFIRPEPGERALDLYTLNT
jgi:hypothetical protein